MLFLFLFQFGLCEFFIFINVWVFGIKFILCWTQLFFCILAFILSCIIFPVIIFNFLLRRNIFSCELPTLRCRISIAFDESFFRILLDLCLFFYSIIGRQFIFSHIDGIFLNFFINNFFKLMFFNFLSSKWVNILGLNLWHVIIT